MLPTPHPETDLARGLIDTLIRAGLIFALVFVCFRIFLPFLHLLLWALILAVTLRPLQVRLRPHLGGSDGRSAALIVVVAIAFLLVPIWMLGTSLTQSVQGALSVVKSGTLQLPPPDESVSRWPLVGRPIYDFWVQAAADLSSVLRRFAPELKDVSLATLERLAGLGLGLLIFIAALMIAAFFLAYAERGAHSAERIASRLCGAQRGPRIVALCTATIRAVAQGVVGIAFIQMLLMGMGFRVMAVPGAGLLSLAVLLLAITQLPVMLIALPVVVFVFVTQGATFATIVFAVYMILAGLVDNVLRPLLLGRGVEVPMPVVLLGALGGVVTGGIIGLFIGPVILAVGYQLFWQWVDDQPMPAAPADQAGA